MNSRWQCMASRAGSRLRIAVIVFSGGVGCSGAMTPIDPGGPCIGVDGGRCGVSADAGSTGDEGATDATDGSAADATTGDDGGACVSAQGEHCGGNTAHPCTCATGLACTADDGGLPFGDVGGTCQPPSCAPLPCPSTAAWDPVSCACVPRDAGASCVATQGGHCGGHTAQPCTCAAGLTCTAEDGGPPFGDVGGTCEPTPVCDPLPCPSGMSWDPVTCACVVPDAGASCVSPQGGHCGGNTAHPCTCETGLVCTPHDGGPPFGDVGGTCEPRAVVCDPPGVCPAGSAWDGVACACEPQCQVASDCHGALPALCAQCVSADGGVGPITGCAHFVCQNGLCETRICD